MASVWWSRSVPNEVARALAPILESEMYLLPGWCYELIVRWEPEDANCAYMTGQRDYRRAKLTVTPHWLDSRPEERVEIVRHEFCHALLHPLTDWTKNIIERLAHDDERLADWLRDEWQERLEGATCDLEDVLSRAETRKST